MYYFIARVYNGRGYILLFIVIYILMITFYNVKTMVLNLCQDVRIGWLKMVALLAKVVSHQGV